MLRIKAERRLETVAAIGLNATDRSSVSLADAIGRMLNALLRVPIRRDGLTRGPVAPQDWSLHGERGRSGSYRGCDVFQAVGREVLG